MPDLIVIVDPCFGNLLSETAKRAPTWIVDTFQNKVAYERLWAEASSRDHRERGATTSFKVTDPQDRQTNLMDIIPQLETHHGSLINNDLHFPSGFELEVIGLPLGNEVKEALREYGFSTFSAKTTGFEAKKVD